MKGLDGKENFSIVIFSGWIYDANFSHALPLCKKSLNACCSSDEVHCQFISFLNTFYFEYFGAYVTANNEGDLNDKKQTKKKHYKKMEKTESAYVVLLIYFMKSCQSIFKNSSGHSLDFITCI